MKTLLNNIPSIPEVFKNYVKTTNLISAGDMKEKTEKTKNNILNKFGDEETQLETERLEKTLEPEYKEILDKSIQDFDKTDKKSN